MAPKKLKGQCLDGIILLDKPVGLSSNEALQKVKRLFSARKAGHTGSLDPLASGLLPICFGQATKFSSYLLNADKHYEVTARLGFTTKTGDSEGDVIKGGSIAAIDVASINSVLDTFTGEIQQLPSMFSAIKHRGQPLYKYARQGIEVERIPRVVIINKISLVHWQGEQLSLRVSCSKGTYIRTLIEDIGNALGCGAYVVALRRIGAGKLNASEMITLADLEAKAALADHGELHKAILPVSNAVRAFVALKLSDAIAHYIKMGQPVFVPNAPTSGYVSLFAGNDEFIGVGEIMNDGKLAPRRLLRHE